MKLTHFILATLVGAACVLLAACSANAGAPVPLTNVLVTVYGEESSAIVHERGELFLFEEDGSTDLWFGDGETPGGRPVNTHLPVPDAYHWEDDVHANSHALVLNPEFSIQATANSFDLRFEGVPVLRIVGNTNGFCVPYTYQFQPEGSTFAISSALVDDAALTLLCSTNLTSVPIFREVPDDLATVTTNNDVVTWVVSADALMAPSGANICVFRVRASTSFGTGIYAKAPIVAEQGLSMGGITWTNLPDVGTIATNAADAAVAPVAGDLADHAADTDNPHGVTAEQVGALPLDGGGVVEGNLHVKKNTYNSGRLSHGQNVTNSGPYSFAGGECVKATGQDAFATGYYTEATGFGSVATGGRTKATGSYAEAHGQLANSTNGRAWVWNGPRSDSSPIYGSHGDGTWNINPQDGLSGAYVGETNLADHIAAAVAPVERRLEVLETASEAYWCRWNSSNTSETNINWIPTNEWPAKRLYLFVTPPSSFTNLDVGIRGGWEPNEDLELIVIWTRAAAGSGGQLFIGTNVVYTMPTGSVRRKLELRWMKGIKRWLFHVSTLEYRNNIFRSDGKSNDALPVDVFLPVFDEAEAASTLSMSPSLSPSVLSPGVAANLELLDSLDALDVPAADEPDEFEPAAEVVE